MDQQNLCESKNAIELSLKSPIEGSVRFQKRGVCKVTKSILHFYHKYTYLINLLAHAGMLDISELPTSQNAATCVQVQITFELLNDLKRLLTEVKSSGRKSQLAHADGKPSYSEQSYYSVCTNTLCIHIAKINLVQPTVLEEINEKTLHNMNNVTCFIELASI